MAQYPKELYKSRLYFCHSHMKDRCNNKNSLDYKNYGGRGITYDKKWESFAGFYKDMKEGYSDKLTLDRRKVNGNYSKNNCRWATRKEQNNNKRNNNIINYKGISKTLTQWGEELGIKKSTLKQRYYVYKWSIDKCFNYNRI